MKSQRIKEAFQAIDSSELSQEQKDLEKAKLSKELGLTKTIVEYPRPTSERLTQYLENLVEAEEECKQMILKKGDRVKHPLKTEWGVGEVISENNSEVVKIFFDKIGEKTISLNHVVLDKVFGNEANSLLLDNMCFDEENITDKNKDFLCKNCGQKTNFGSTASHGRVSLGWCSTCYKRKGGYLDYIPTIDGPKNYFKGK